MSKVEIHQLAGFDDPSFSPLEWDALLRAGDTDELFLTWTWQRTWWETFGRGELLLLLAVREGSPVALAPLFADCGMVYFVGAGGSDYLDFIGDVSDPEILDELLCAARDKAPDFAGFVFHHVLDGSRTGPFLASAADRLGLRCFSSDRLDAPIIAFDGETDVVTAAAGKKSLVRHERSLAREDSLELRLLTDPSHIETSLDELFEQHERRWAATPYPSLFLDERWRHFFRRIGREGADAGWLRFTRLEWGGRPIALHFGFHRCGSYFWFKPSFDVTLARRSPGEVLLRRLLLSAADEGATRFDFGIGQEAFKMRFANRVRAIENWNLYPREGG